MIKDLSILLGTYIILYIIDLSRELSIIIFMIVLFCVFLKVYNETTENTNFKGNPEYNGWNNWTQEQWDNWDTCSKENIDELYKNEFKLDENGNWKYKGDHI